MEVAGERERAGTFGNDGSLGSAVAKRSICALGDSILFRLIRKDLVSIGMSSQGWGTKKNSEPERERLIV